MLNKKMDNYIGTVDVGYISDRRLSIESSIVTMKPHENHSEIVKVISEKYYAEGGFCFPYIAKSKYRKEVINKQLVDVKIADIPPYQPELFRFPTTHNFKLLVDGSTEKLDDFVRNPTLFILQVIGYVQGYRIMPETFWFDGKIPVKPTSNVICNSYDTILSKGFDLWLASSEEARKDILGIFYFFNRSPSYHWPFERFSHDFMVFDSAMKFYSKNVIKSEYKKKKKYEHFLESVRIKFPVEDLIDLADRRNDLFHEIKWGEGAPGLFDDSNMFERTFRFRRFLHAVLGRLLGLDGNYFENSDWGERGTFLLDAK